MNGTRYGRMDETRYGSESLRPEAVGALPGSRNRSIVVFWVMLNGWVCMQS